MSKTIEQASKELPKEIQSLVDAIKKADQKIVFGLEAQGHIPTIEKMIEKSGNNIYTWEKIGKEIGWCHRTAMCWYMDYLIERQSEQTKEDAIGFVNYIHKYHFICNDGTYGMNPPTLGEYFTIRQLYKFYLNSKHNKDCESGTGLQTQQTR